MNYSYNPSDLMGFTAWSEVPKDRFSRHVAHIIFLFIESTIPLLPFKILNSEPLAIFCGSLSQARFINDNFYHSVNE